MPKARNPSVTTQKLLEGALTCFVTRGLQATSMDDLTKALDISNRTLYGKLGNKATIIEMVYAYATAQLLVGHPEELHKGEKLTDYLKRWWQQAAAAALDNPRAFRYWQLYRTSSPATATDEPVLGPFAAVFELLSGLLAQADVKQTADALPLPVLSRWWAAQWTAAVEVVLADPTCKKQPALGQRLLTQAYTSWWQSVGVSATVLATKTAPKPTGTTLFLTAVAQHIISNSNAAPPSSALSPKGAELLKQLRQERS
jgi:AcrR family transcriptional regulator